MKTTTITCGRDGVWITLEVDPTNKTIASHKIMDDREFADWKDAYLKDHPQEAHKSSGCGKNPVVRWMFVRWIGVPYFKRLYLRSPITKAGRDGIQFRWPIDKLEFPGCGCLVKLKVLWLAIRWVWKA